MGVCVICEVSEHLAGPRAASEICVFGENTANARGDDLHSPNQSVGAPGREGMESGKGAE